jgi:glycogen debranching enzyme
MTTPTDQPPGGAEIASNGARPATLNPHSLVATSTLTEVERRVLKHGDTFAVFDRYGDVAPGGLGEHGLYHEGTRFLSCLLFELYGQRPFFLSSTVRDDNDRFEGHLTNPDLVEFGRVHTPLGTLHLAVEKFLWRATCYQQFQVNNHGRAAVAVDCRLTFRADFADIFEVRGQSRGARGKDLKPQVVEDRVILSYHGLDGVERRTALQFTPAPARLTHDAATWACTLEPGASLLIAVAVSCERESERVSPFPAPIARDLAAAEHGRAQAWVCRLTSVNGQFNAWFNRAVSDLHMMTTALPSGPYPYAGLPWFNTPFGRDGLITALECLWMRPELALGVLRYLGATQATRIEADQDAEPGKILHEMRTGEMAALKEIPYGKYYGSVDATPLFVLLAGAYYERTADRDSIAALWPHIAAALCWIEKYGDPDGDGLVEYQRKSPTGLLHQGWKDSDEAICHADLSPTVGPIALCEVQGYVFAAFRAAARLASALERPGEAAEFESRADRVKQRFEELFWCEDLGTYVLALDGDKRPCCVRSSNAAHCLFTGIADAERARRIAQTILHSDFFSGWGVRTLAASEAPYNPLSYHNGSVWPHDNALIAWGLARYGETKSAARLLAGLFEAGQYFDLNRMPELFCGFPRHAGAGPIPYPVACAPQSWSAASVFLLIQASLGLKVDGPARRVIFSRPVLPSSLPELHIFDLEVGGARVDLILTRHEDDVSIRALRKQGQMSVLIEG